MIKAHIYGAKAFENFLRIINRFVSLGTFIVTEEKTVFYAINPQEFPSSRIEMETNIMTLIPGASVKNKKEEYPVSTVKMSFNELQKFRSSLEMMDSFYKKNEFDLNIEASLIAKDSDQKLPVGTVITKKIF